MTHLGRCLLIILLLSAHVLFAASSAEKRAFQAGLRPFDASSWDYAEQNFATFIQRFPESEYLAEAILRQAQARYQMGRYAGAVELLTAHPQIATNGEYFYWLGAAHFHNTNYPAAAAAFARLTKQFPDSPRRLEAAIGEATAHAKLGEWSRITELIQQSDGAFQQAARQAGTNELIARGYLLLGEAQLEQKDYASASATLHPLMAQKAGAEINWRTAYLQCRLQLDEGQVTNALLSTTNLIELAQMTGDAELQAETTVLHAKILESLGRLDDAIIVYQRNLTPSAPANQQSHALLKITELKLRQNKPAEAALLLEQYLEQQPAPPASDRALLALGELQLAQYTTAGTNSAPALLKQALDRFDTLLNVYSNSPLVGKALLNRGWCLWVDNRFTECKTAFQLATERLPFSKDQAVARFKWADSLFMLKNFAAAITNYNFIVDHYSSDPEVREQLLERALYQTVRASLDVTNLPAATEAMLKIWAWYPNGSAGDHCLLLVGRDLAQSQDTAGARKLYADYEKLSTRRDLLPELHLAIARTYELEGDWPAAITNYEAWASTFTNRADLLPLAEFYRASATASAGQDTNALMLFTNFVARFPTNELAPQAQWWIGDYYFGQHNYQEAERNYRLVRNTNLPTSQLMYQAQRMAGLSAIGYLNYKDAIDYFTKLANKPECPLPIRIQAAFDAGEAYTMHTESGAQGRGRDLEEAIGWFTYVLSYPTNAQAIRAMGRIGDCQKELEHYDKARDAYQQVIASTNAIINLRSQAEIGLGIIAEKQAALKSGADQTNQLLVARGHYQDVFYENNLRDGERSDPYSVKDAGIRAGRLFENLNDWLQAYCTYTNLEGLFPSLRAELEPKIARVKKNLTP
jgi:TolA-binding protein